MAADLPSSRLPRLLGLGTALLVGAPIWVQVWERRAGGLEPRIALWSGAYAVFAGAFWLATSAARQGRGGLFCRALLALESVAVVVMAGAASHGSAGALLVVTAAQAGEVLSLGGALLWVIVQTAGFGLALAHDGHAVAWSTTALFAAFECFALYSVSVAVQERRAREELGHVNVALRLAQARLAESARVEERLRLSRDLHDVMGHHLTALSLSLEAARHAPAGQVPELLERAHALNRRLLQDLRRVVSAFRDEGPVDLTRALAELGAGIDQPQVHLSVPDGLRLEDPERARTALRCVQEIATNAIRHAGARNLWLVLDPQPEGLWIRGRDDGRGTASVSEGLGLGGMRERLQVLGGQLLVSSSAGGGFEVEAFIPAGPGAP